MNFANQRTNDGHIQTGALTDMSDQQAQGGHEKYPCRIESLDDLLDGGLIPGTITEVLGYGKSMLLNTIVLNMVPLHDFKAIIIAYNHKFTCLSLQNMLKERGIPNEQAEEILNAIKIEYFTTTEELDAIVEELLQNPSVGRDHRLVVFESISSLFLLHYMQLYNKFNSDMNDILQKIRRFAFESRCLVLMSSQMIVKNSHLNHHSNFLADLNDKSWKSMMDHRIMLNSEFLESDYENTIFKTEVKLLKSRHSKSGKTCILYGTKVGMISNKDAQ